MHKFKRRSQKNVIGFKLSGRLTKEEYDEIIDYLQKKIDQYGSVRLMIELDHWEGWAPMVVVKDLFFVFKNTFKIERVAFVVCSEEDKQAVLIDQPFSPWFRGTTKYFSKKNEAWDWVNEGITKTQTTEEKDLSVQPKKKLRYGPKMNILIIGGGLSGLLLASLLRIRGFKPYIVESKKEHARDYGVFNFPGNAASTLKSLGIYKKLLPHIQTVPSMDVLNHQGKILESYSYDSIGNMQLIGYGRLLKILLESLEEKSVLRMGVSATKCSQAEEGVRVHFSDGSLGTFDAVICSDGVHSRMRDRVMEGEGGLVYSGLLGWNFHLYPSFPCPDKILDYRAQDKFLRIYPKGSRVYIYAGCQAPLPAKTISETDAKKLFQETFCDFKGLVPQILNDLNNTGTIWCDAIYGVDYKSWIQDRVAFLGNAAQAFMPMSLMNSSMTLESTFILAEELSRSDTEFLPLSLRRYEMRTQNLLNKISELLNKYDLTPAICAYEHARNLEKSLKPISKENWIYFWQDWNLILNQVVF